MLRMTCLLALVLAPVSAMAIVGGRPVEPYEKARKHTVLVIGEGSRCSGAVVDTDMILTAAHCFGGSKRIRVLFRDPQNRVVEIVTDTVAIHPGFNPEGRSVRERGVDLALVRLPQPFPNYMAAVAIGDMEEEGAVRISGFGLHEEGAPVSSNALRQAVLIGKPTQAGASMVILAVGAGVNGALTGVGACVGDSGGPMISERTQLLVGIIGSGIPLPGARGACGGYTAAIRIADHLPWIHASADAMRRLVLVPSASAAPPR